MKALNDLITSQKLEYNFKYYMMEFPTDIPVLTLSEGKSILEVLFYFYSRFVHYNAPQIGDLEEFMILSTVVDLLLPFLSTSVVKTIIKSHRIWFCVKHVKICWDRKKISKLFLKK